MERDSGFSGFVLEHENDDTSRLLLSKGKWKGIDIDLAVNTILSRKKLKNKVPAWYSEPALVFPAKLSAEQCSSQDTAAYKAGIAARLLSEAGLPEGKGRIADLTGGLGVDTWSLAHAAASIDYFERSEELCACARHNFHILGRDNITVHTSEISREMLHGIPSGSYSLIYLDPARRNKGGGRVYSLKDCEPDITGLRQELLRIAPRILLKASPMADISVLLSQLPEAAEVHILSSDNECKEVLILMLRNNSLPAEEIPIVAAELQSGDNSGEGTE